MDSRPCWFCGGIHYGTQPGRCVYQCANCGKDTRTPAPLADGERWEHKCTSPRESKNA